ncbi:hypothetical protein HaLaN_06521 [Haematococcus lacustris]|uniref:Uncharacterized protein n=1 Tax=Haematococcus lacustris TaxID=44745 RepID=A0A699YP58_HAELA|nr:hypothetical protein HaLaN_06521 [Haematococcus lacustris]
MESQALAVCSRSWLEDDKVIGAASMPSPATSAFLPCPYPLPKRMSMSRTYADHAKIQKNAALWEQGSTSEARICARKVRVLARTHAGEQADSAASPSHRLGWLRCSTARAELYGMACAPLSVGLPGCIAELSSVQRCGGCMRRGASALAAPQRAVNG